MEPATMDRIQRLIDDEVTERFPEDVAPQLALLRYGDHPVIEPGELYLRVILRQDGAARDVWMQEHGGHMPDLLKMPGAGSVYLSVRHPFSPGPGPR